MVFFAAKCGWHRGFPLSSLHLFGQVIKAGEESERTDKNARLLSKYLANPLNPANKDAVDWEILEMRDVITCSFMIERDRNGGFMQAIWTGNIPEFPIESHVPRELIVTQYEKLRCTLRPQHAVGWTDATTLWAYTYGWTLYETKYYAESPALGDNIKDNLIKDVEKIVRRCETDVALLTMNMLEGAKQNQAVLPE